MVEGGIAIGEGELDELRAEDFIEVYIAGFDLNGSCAGFPVVIGIEAPEVDFAEKIVILSVIGIGNGDLSVCGNSNHGVCFFIERDDSAGYGCGLFKLYDEAEFGIFACSGGVSILEKYNTLCCESGSTGNGIAVDKCGEV